MTIRYITGSTVVSTAGTDAFTAAVGDTVILAPGGVLGAQGPSGGGNSVYGIHGDGAGFFGVFNSGLIFGTNGGIYLNAVGSTADVLVGATGQVFSEGIGAFLQGGLITVENLGLIRGGNTGLYVEAGNSAVVQNHGTISGNSFGVALASGTLTLVNTGTISGGSNSNGISQSGNFAATVWNTGTVVGSVTLGGGNDLYQGGGTVTTFVNGDAGDDTLIGGDRDDTLLDFYGSNWIAGGNGSDRVSVAVLGFGIQTSHIFGGIIGGADTSGNDTIECQTDGLQGANIFLSAGTAVGSVTRTSDGAVAAWITGFENAVGTFLADAIIGSSAANAIEGAGGADWMVGNGGADRFVFRFSFDAVAGDQIRDFRRSEADRIDLSAIDANFSTSDNDAFVFRTTRTSNAAAEAVITNFGNSARVDLYTNADNTVDGTFIVVYGESGVTNLQASDFIL